jgi:DNA-binding transcriptional LysR family regulator
MASDIGWELYRSFLAVLDEGSLSAAARSLGVAQPTMGRHVATLEKSLGLALFTRSQLGLMPTEAAQSLRSFAESMQSTAAALERTDSDLAHLALIRSGAGIGICQAAIARRDDAIVRILAKQFSLPLETWITMHEDLRNSPRCRVTFDALVEGLQQHVAQLPLRP